MTALKANYQTIGIYMRIIVLMLLFFVTVNSYADEMVLTQGRATTDIENLYECVDRYRKSGMGHVIDKSEKRWIVPAPVAFSKARKATDLYNQCNHLHHRLSRCYNQFQGLLSILLKTRAVQRQIAWENPARHSRMQRTSR